MSKKKQGGKLVQRKRPQPKYLGVKVADGEAVKIGAILVRQRGSKIKAGEGVETGRDYTLFAAKDGVVKFGRKLSKKIVRIV
jgi:large subunit ribosomal protein L27